MASAGPLVRLPPVAGSRDAALCRPPNESAKVPSTLNGRMATGVTVIPLPIISPRMHCGTRGHKPLSRQLTKLSIEGSKSVMERTGQSVPARIDRANW